MISEDNSFGDYIESSYKPEKVFLSDETYSQALDSIVVACLDILPTYEGRILIGQRAYHPQADWWFFGGRFYPGETSTSSAKRLIMADIGLAVDEKRFKYLTTFSAAWERRAQKPEYNGSHTLSVVVTFELTPKEYKRIKLGKEYLNSKLVSKSELMDEKTYHPALVQCARAF